jgi:hypothetical protein
MRFPGEVWFLPPDHLRGDDGKSRRQVLLTACEERGQHATLAYASSQQTEAAFGAAHVLLDPGATAYGRGGGSGFTRPACVYPSRLVGVGSEEMQRFAGRIIDEFPFIRTALRHALGMGAGGQVANTGWRGCVVRFTSGVSKEIGCEHGLIVTEPVYAERERYQLVVPVLDLRRLEPAARDVVADGKPWIPLLFGTPAPIALAVEMIQTVFHPTDVEHEIVAVVDQETLAEVEDRLRERFGL